MSLRHDVPARSRRRELPRCTLPSEALAVRSRAFFLLFARFFRRNIKRINPFRFGLSHLHLNNALHHHTNGHRPVEGRRPPFNQNDMAISHKPYDHQSK